MQWYGAGVWFYGFSVVFKAILGEFGWARAVTRDPLWAGSSTE